MRHVSDVKALQIQKAPSDPKTEAMKDWVRQIARLYSDTPSSERAITRAEIRSMTNGPMRFLAFVGLSPRDPDFQAFKLLFDDLNAEVKDGIYVGWMYFPVTDLGEAGALVNNGPTGLEIRFPVRWPWDELPDPDGGFQGVRGTPVYRSQDDRKKALEEREAFIQKMAERGDRSWWEPKDYQGPGATAPRIEAATLEPPDDIPF